MSKIISIEEKNSVLVISTEGYLNKDLATSVFDESLKYIEKGTGCDQKKNTLPPPFQIFLTVAKKNPYPQGLSSDRPRNAVN